MCILMHIYILLHIYMYTHTHTHTHTFTYAWIHIYIYAVLGISSKYLEEKEEEEEEDYIDAFGNKIMPRDMTFLIRTSTDFSPIFFFLFNMLLETRLCPDI